MTIQYTPIKEIIEKLYDQVKIRRKMITVGDLYPRIMQGQIEKILDAIKELEKPYK
jgi:archaellum component FlaC